MSAGTHFRARPDGLVLAPFRAVRFAADRVGDLGAVTAPPYDVVDAEGATALERADPHNIVRLILPHPDAADPRGRYAGAGRTLQQWLADGVLAVEDRPALYVYEHAADGQVQRGLIGALALRDPQDGVVLPHEDVMPGPVEDRLELLRATSANLEPILLIHEGGRLTAEAIERVCTEIPLLEAGAGTGDRHRVWRITDDHALGSIAADLSGRVALIADGHHRYAAYRAYQREQHAAGRGAGAWDYGLALLVDFERHPLTVRAIHRVVTGIGYDEALARTQGVFRVTALNDVPPETPPAAFVVTDGLRSSLLTLADHDVVNELLPEDSDALWRELDATILHELVLGRLWDVADEDVAYEHDRGHAVERARGGAIAVLMAPVEPGLVTELAKRAVRMPRKSTSFGPKPRSGLVLRRLEG